MAKNRPRKRFRERKVSVAVLAGMVYPILDARAEYGAKGAKGIPISFVRNFTGFNPNDNYRFAVANLGQGLIPVLAGYGIHKIANRFGINRMLAPIPFVQI